MTLIAMDMERNAVAEASRKYVRGEIEADEVRAVERQTAGNYRAAILGMARARPDRHKGVRGLLAWLLAV